jgi:imidazolonepropionase-like amidohydrolase
MKRGALTALLAAAAMLLAACAPAPRAGGGAGGEARVLLLAGGLVVDPSNEGPARRADVLIVGDRISQVGTRLRAPSGAQRIDVGGLWLVPGLWDMHAHVAAEGPTSDALEDYVGHGVLGIRDMGGRFDEVLALRDAVARGERTGPTMVVAGPTVNGMQGGDFHLVVRDGAEARAAVRELHRRGVDFIKIHRALSHEAFLALRDEARAVGLAFAGHVPLALEWDEAAAAGMDTVEHVQTIVENELEPGGDPVAAAMAAMGRLERRRGHEIFAALARHRVAWTPTLIYYETSWRSDPADRRALKQQLYARMAPLVGLAHRLGVPILAGTDLMEARGAGLHDELDRLVRAGLTPRQALAAATTSAFAVAGRGPGPIRPGGEASLIAVAADPAEDIANLRRLRLVVLRGRLIPPRNGEGDHPQHGGGVPRR